jgi:hypothetical protein
MRETLNVLARRTEISCRIVTPRLANRSVKRRTAGTRPNFWASRIPTARRYTRTRSRRRARRPPGLHVKFVGVSGGCGTLMGHGGRCFPSPRRALLSIVMALSSLVVHICACRLRAKSFWICDGEWLARCA